MQLLTEVVKRDGSLVVFDRSRIDEAVRKAFVATGTDESGVEAVTDSVLAAITERFADGRPRVEDIQDLVERQLVEHGRYEVAKSYILYRARRAEARVERSRELARLAEKGQITVVKRDGQRQAFNLHKLEAVLRRLLTNQSTSQTTSDVLEPVLKETLRTVFDGIKTADLERALSQAASAFIERDPVYDAIAARVLLQRMYREIFGQSVTNQAELAKAYRAAFVKTIEQGVAEGAFAPELKTFKLARLAEKLKIERDELLEYLGVQTLHERYFVRFDDKPFETPQAFWMRVAMGLALNEADPEARAVQFYEVLSTLRFVASTPTLFHSGLSHPQLSSCYLSTIGDDLTSIFKVMGDNAQLSKWSGGIGNDWTSVRATGAAIKSTKVQSQGVIPFLKIANDTTLAINRSGKRRGATCAYLETWHLDIEDFLDLRRNTGDERRRTHDMNTANWIPDLFMKRVRAEGEWTLFSPEEVPDLHELYGAAFEEKYLYYEAEAAAGRIALFKKVEAVKLWRKMLARLYETGHPWITFKDPSNIRSPQDHAGVVHNSNLCTEITLNNSATETAVCNLGSLNFATHLMTVDGEVKLDEIKLAETVDTAMRMLDNVIDINYYPTVEARDSNLRHRPVGLGLMGFQDALFELGLSFEDQAALDFADQSMELVAYNAILSSSRLAKERGTYESYQGSKWDRGIFPIDTLALLEAERGEPVRVDRSERLDWAVVRDHVRQYGMRNSNTMAIAPTATISTISGCMPCIEPIYKNVYVKSNMSGEFTILNKYLVRDLKKLGLWGPGMLDKLKHADGDLTAIPEIPAALKARYKEAFDIDPVRLIEFTAVRGKWIDQSQSHNVFMRGTSGTQMHKIYFEAWERGLKTTYYLRTLAASQIEKSTLDASFGYTQKRTDKPAFVEDKTGSAMTTDEGALDQGRLKIESAELSGGRLAVAERVVAAEPKAAPAFKMHSIQVFEAPEGVDGPKACLVDDPECEACQ